MAVTRERWFDLLSFLVVGAVILGFFLWCAYTDLSNGAFPQGIIR